MHIDDSHGSSPTYAARSDIAFYGLVLHIHICSIKVQEKDDQDSAGRKSKQQYRIKPNKGSTPFFSLLTACQRLNNKLVKARQRVESQSDQVEMS